MSRIVELNAQLLEERRAYYAGTPKVSDGEYDLHEAELRGLVKAHPEEAHLATALTTVGTDTKGRIKHRNPMRSIQNMYSFEELCKWAEALGWPPMTLSPKFDGISCSLTYEKGELVRALTRGDGDAGESILDQIKACRLIPKKLPVPIDIEVRGELVMKRSRMLELNAEIVAAGGDPYVSPRNLAAGTMKQQDLEEVAKRQIHFCPWEVLSNLLDSPESGADSAGYRLDDLASLGFEVVGPVLTVVNPVSLKTALDTFIALLAEKDPEIALDGAVLKVDSCALRRELGLGTNFAKFQVAFKPQNSQTETVLLDVIWQVGRQGRLTPVGIIKPVVLAGATIERVTLNNLSWIRSMGLAIGKRVMVMRSGEVIPKITEVLED